MRKFDVFQYLLYFVSESYEVTDADMNSYRGGIEIAGEKDGQKIKITVELEEVVEE